MQYPGEQRVHEGAPARLKDPIGQSAPFADVEPGMQKEPAAHGPSQLEFEFRVFAPYKPPAHGFAVPFFAPARQ